MKILISLSFVLLVANFARANEPIDMVAGFEVLTCVKSSTGSLRCSTPTWASKPYKMILKDSVGDGRSFYGEETFEIIEGPYTFKAKVVVGHVPAGPTKGYGLRGEVRVFITSTNKEIAKLLDFGQADDYRSWGSKLLQGPKVDADNLEFHPMLYFAF